MSQGEAFQIGLRIGKYELTRKLGEGGFGVLFVARDTSLDRELAIKFLHPHHSSNPDVVKRFVQEARSIAKVVHPGIVTVYESGEVWGTQTRADGAAFIIMELLNGETLTSRLKNSGGRIAPATAMEICRQVASALEAAHRQGVVHRDLKPDNIMLVKDLALNLGERAKVLDFGIAKIATATPSGATVAGMVFGTPNYMSPEQCRSAADANHSSDIYSLGCILFELVTGHAPFQGGMAELIAHHILTPPPVPSQVVPGLPPHIDDVIAAMLAKDPNNRPASMTVVEAILEERRLVPTKTSSGGGARTRTLGGARLATSPPPMTGQPMQPGARPLPGMMLSASDRAAIGTPTPTPPPTMVAPAYTPPAVGAPTTLSSAAGIAAKLDKKSSGKWWIAVPIVIVAAIGTVLAISRGGGDGSDTGTSSSVGTDSTGSATAEGSAAIGTGSATTGTAGTGSAAAGSAATATGSAATTTTSTGSAATSGSAATTTTTNAGSAATAATTGGAATGSAATTTTTNAGSAAATTTTTNAGSAATTTKTTNAGSAATTTTTTTTNAGSAAITKTTGTTAGSAATTTKTTGTTAGSAATTTKTTGTTAGSAATTTKTTGTTAGSAATTTKTTGTTTKTTGATAGSASTTTKTTGTTTKTTGATAGSASTTTKTTGTTTKTTGTTTKTPDPAQGSAAKKCQGRSCILDGNF